MSVSRARRAIAGRRSDQRIGKILLTKKGGDLLEPPYCNVDLVNQCLELAVIQAVGEDGVDNLHHNRHDVNEVGRLGAQRLLVNDAVLLVYGMGVSGGPDCNAIAEQGSGPDARPSWAGSGPRAGGCPHMS